MSDDQRAGGDGSITAEPTRVERNRLLLVEGEFDVGFFRALLSRHGRAGVQVEALGGVAPYAKKVEALSNAPGFDQLHWLGLARDADNDAEAALASMRNAFSRIAERFPSNQPTRAWEMVSSDDGTRSVTLLIFPDGTHPGDLERLIWDALSSEREANCVETYVQCLRSVGCDLPREWKTRVFAYLSSRARPDSFLSAATRAGELPTDSPVFRRLLDLLPADD
ncbi:MAG: DUF3226 domain-containing protein [Thermomicrobiales bacterium]